MIDSAVTDLPEPDSPTTATVSPRPTENDRLRTAVTTRSVVANSTVRSATSMTLEGGRDGTAGRLPANGVERQTFSGSRAGRFISSAGVGPLPR